MHLPEWQGGHFYVYPQRKNLLKNPASLQMVPATMFGAQSLQQFLQI